jgi:2'-5' RNA ligase
MAEESLNTELLLRQVLEDEDDDAINQSDLIPKGKVIEGPWTFDTVARGQHNLGMPFNPEGLYDIVARWKGRTVYEQPSKTRSVKKTLKQLQDSILSFEDALPYDPARFKDPIDWFMAAKCAMTGESCQDQEVDESLLKEDEDDDAIDQGDLMTPIAPPIEEVRKWLEENTDAEDNAAYNDPEEDIRYKFSSWGLYHGTTVDVANARGFAKKYKFVHLEESADHDEGHAEIVDNELPDVPGDEFEKFKEDFEGLSDYPSLDDEVWSSVQSEFQDKQWDSFWKKEFKDSLVKEYPYLNGIIDALYEGDYFYEMVHEAEDHANEVWIEETGCSFHYRTEAVMKHITVEELLKYAEMEPERQYEEFSEYTQKDFTGVLVEYFPDRKAGIDAVMATPTGFALFKDAVKRYNSGASEYWHIIEEMTPAFLNHWLPIKGSQPGPGQATLPLGETEGVHDHSCVMATVADEVSGAVITWGRTRVDDEDVYEGEGDDVKGRENEPHVTVLYGLTETKPSPELLKIIEDTKPFTVEVGTSSMFENEEYDVLKFDVESEDLRALNTKLKELNYTETHPGYHPHLAVAYVKKGTCKEATGQHLMVGDDEGKVVFEVNEVVFSGSGEEGTKTTLFLGKPNVL